MKRELERIANLATEIEELAKVDWIKLHRNDADEMNKLAMMIGGIRARAGIIRTRAEVAGMTPEEIGNALVDVASVGSKS